MNNHPNQLANLRPHPENLRLGCKKGIRLQRVSQRIKDFDAGLLVECPKHGKHRQWFEFKQVYNGYRNLRCRHCQREFSRNTVAKYYLRTLARYAKRRDKTSTIDEGFLKDLLLRQGNSCALTGINFSESLRPSLDRIDSGQGYTHSNVQLVLSEINRMKTNLSQERFIQLCVQVCTKARSK